MANQVAVDVEVAWPYIQKRLERYLAGASLGSGGSAGGATVGEHALDGPLHSGTLARTQAPWVATDIASAIASHALLPDVHHARQHGILSSSDHTVTGSAWDVIGLSGTNALGVLGSSSNPGVAEKLLRTAADGSVNVVALISAQGSAQGGAIVQGVLDVDTSYARAWFGHNAQWDATANTWNIDAIGANDAGGFFIPNSSSSIDLIFHPSTGTTSRTMTHADFIAGAKFRFASTGRASINSTDTSTYTLNVNGTIRSTGNIYANSDIEMTGELLAANGAVGAPSIAFLSDTDTGLYRTGTNAFSLVAGGTAIVNVGATGAGVNVAFDSTAALKVQSIANDDITLFLKQKSGQTARMWRVEDSAGQELIVLDSQGNLQSGNPGFVSGLTGWQITPPGNAEFNNAWIRGELHASIFVMDEFHASGGTLYIAPAGKLENDATVYTTTVVQEVLDVRTTSGTFSGTQVQVRTTSGTFSGTTVTRRYIKNYFDISDPPSGHAMILSAGDIIRCKALGLSVGIDLWDIWGVVSYVEDHTTYYRYYYDRKSGGTDGLIIPAGTAIISYGKPGDGRIYLTADQNYAPYWQIFITGQEPWNGDIIPTVRGGRLDGVGLPGVSGIPQYGIVMSTDLSDASAPYMVMSNLQQFMYNIDSEWNNGNPTARITAGGAFKLGTDIDNPATTGFDFNPLTGAVTIGSASYPGSVTVYGSITVTGGNAAKTDFSNITATLDNVPNGATYFRTTANQVTGAGRAYTAINSSNNLVTSVIPATAVTPGGAGLFLGSNYMGYYNGTDWKTYIDSSGNMKLLGNASNNYLQWAASSNKLQGVGGGTEQWYADATDGKFKAGAGAIVLERTGLLVANDATSAGIVFHRTNSFSSSTKAGRLWALSDLSPLRVYMSAGRSVGVDSDASSAEGIMDIVAYNGSGTAAAALSLVGSSGVINATGSLSISGDIDMNGNDILDVGTIGDVGNWTPVITFGGGNTGLTYAARAGRYIKIGKLVFASAYIALSNKGSSTGAAKINGLPATHASTISSAATIMWYQMATNWVNMNGLVDTGNTSVSLYGHTAASASYTGLTHADFANNSLIQMTVMYEAA